MSATAFLLHYKLHENALKKNASTNGGDASRVGDSADVIKWGLCVFSFCFPDARRVAPH